MRKTLFLAAIAAVAMVSCSKEQATEQISQKSGISFRSNVGTRGVDVTTANLTEFQAIIDYDDAISPTMATVSVPFVSDGASSPKYNSATPQWWPDDTYKANIVTFSAYAPTKIYNATEDNGAKKLTGIVIPANIDDQVDIVAAYNEGSKQDNEETGVSLTFNHQLAKVSVAAKCATTGGIGNTVELKGVKLLNLKNEAALALPTKTDGGVWTVDATKVLASMSKTLKEAVTLGDVATSAMGADTAAYILPQTTIGWEPKDDRTNTNNNFAVAVLVKITKGATLVYPETGATYAQDGFAYAAVGLSNNFEAGKHYLITLDFTNGSGWVSPDTTPDASSSILKPGAQISRKPIFFATVTVVDWVDATPINPGI